MAGQSSDDLIVEDATSGDDTRGDAAVRAYARAGGSRRLIVAAVVGFVAFNAGSTWLFGIAGKCGILHFASQFSGGSERFDWLVQGCTVPASVQMILLPDFLVMAGYWLMFTAIIVGGWWRITVPALRRAAWVLWLPTIAFACDAVEYVLLSVLMHKRPDGQFAYRGEGGLLNVVQMAFSSAKWLAVAAMVVAGLVAAAAWFTRRDAAFPPGVSPPPDTAPVAVDDDWTTGRRLLDRLTAAVLVALTTFVVAWVLGLFMTHCAIDSGQLGPAYCAPPPIPTDHFQAPSVVFAVVGVSCLAVGALARTRGAGLRAAGAVLVAASLFLAVWLVWAPSVFRSLDDARGAAVVAAGVIALGVAAGIAAGWANGPWLSRALRAVAAAGTILWALAVMYAVATSAEWSVHAPWGTLRISAMSRWTVIVAAAVLVAVYVVHTAGRRRAGQTVDQAES
ncbi:hypothetical protein AU196_08755 [Mycobacterium sp. IS-1742]|uniref:hypothetical protein n=1 Tax=Mycobacterium sp. IS-1742 TaxID=1772285 RepID=UPI0007402B3A|nr:hypothetical protein [Mycobacterium sp. IS-1742]KUI31934.1 hypothetical protein AU196_08755 [Mycobacterium sp. IS-1742]